MELLALRYVFAGKNSFGKPQGIPLPVSEKEAGQLVVEQNGYWEIKTHDRGDDESNPSHAYFQITFRVHGTPEEKSSHIVMIKGINNCQLEYDSDSDLWYQKTWFNKKGKVEDDHYRVDSITTAGAFEVIVVEKESGTQIIDKHVQVMPSSITKAEYQSMVDRLLEIHERLITTNSSVGIGRLSNSLTSSNRFGEWDFALWEEMKPMLKAIIGMPSDLLQKEYTRMSADKIKRFDSRVLRSFAQHNGTQRLDGIMYKSNNDIYENRVIKSFLARLSQRNPISPGKIINIQQQLRSDLSNEYYNLDINSILSRVITSDTSTPNVADQAFNLTMKSRLKSYWSGKQRSLAIQTSYLQTRRTYAIETNNRKGKFFLHYPMLYDGVDCAVSLETQYADVALRFIEDMTGLYASFDNGEVPYNGSVTISGTGMLQQVDVGDYDIKKAYFLQLTSYSSMTLTWKNPSIEENRIHIPQSMTLDMYFSKISEIRGKHRNDYIVISDARLDVVDFIASRRQRYEKLNSENKKRIQQVKVQREMTDVVHDAWFQSIQTLPHIELPIKSTPKFSYNRFYHSIYELLQKYIELHPLLTSDFDTNAFGTKETWQIYEYWIFSELLGRLMNLGFRISYGANSIKNSLVSFFSSSTQPEGFHVKLEKKYLIDETPHMIEVLFGYNCFVGDQTDRVKGDRHYTPDYYLRIKAENAYHWYFMDAKYNVYEKGTANSSAKNLFQEIYEVPVYKYIYRMTEQGFLDTMTQQLSVSDPETWNVNIKNVVVGAYVIVANILNENEKSDSRIADEDRLYGGVTSLANQYTPNDSKRIVPTAKASTGQMYFPSIDDDQGFPRHRYGAIQCKPGYEDELIALLEMIFEYKETEDTGLLVKFGEVKSWPTNLSLCWDATFDHQDIPLPRVDSRLTIGGKLKFAVACQCGAQRYENHCLKKHGIIKHNLNSYHFRRAKSASRRSLGDKWNYVCPVCGKDLNDEEGNFMQTASSDGVSYDQEPSVYFSYDDDFIPPPPDEYDFIPPPDEESYPF